MIIPHPTVFLIFVWWTSTACAVNCTAAFPPITNITGYTPVQISLVDPGTTCTWTFIAPIGQRLSSSFGGSCVYDSDVFGVYDGPNSSSPVIGMLYSGLTGCVQTTGRALTISFTGVLNLNRYNLPTLYLYLNTYSDTFTYCSGLVNYTVGTGISGSEPSTYSSYGCGTYRSGICQWLYTSDANTYLQVSISGVSLESLDSMTIYSGPNTSFPILGITNGNYLCVFSSGPQVLLVLNSRAGSKLPYQGLMWSLQPRPSPARCDAARAVLPAGYFAYPSVLYFNGARYPSNQTCEFLFNASTPGNGIAGYFPNFQLGVGDTITLYDGSSSLSPVLAVLYYNGAGTQFQSSGSSVLLVLSSPKNSTGGYGFCMQNWEYTLPFTMSTVSLQSGYIPAAYYGYGYLAPFNQTISFTYTTSPGNGYVLFACTLDLGPTEFLDFYSLYPNNATTLLFSLNASSESVFPTLYSATTRLLVKYRTTQVATELHVGWHFYAYEATLGQCNSTGMPLTPLGDISLQYLPPNGRNCSWLLDAGAGQYIQYTLRSLSVRDGIDTLRIYDGNKVNASALIFSQSGSFYAYQPFNSFNVHAMSTGRYMLVVLSMGNNVTNTFLSLCWTASAYTGTTPSYCSRNTEVTTPQSIAVGSNRLGETCSFGGPVADITGFTNEGYGGQASISVYDGNNASAPLIYRCPDPLLCTDTPLSFTNSRFYVQYQSILQPSCGTNAQFCLSGYAAQPVCSGTSFVSADGSCRSLLVTNIIYNYRSMRYYKGEYCEVHLLANGGHVRFMPRDIGLARNATIAVYDGGSTTSPMLRRWVGGDASAFDLSYLASSGAELLVQFVGPTQDGVPYDYGMYYQADTIDLPVYCSGLQIQIENVTNQGQSFTSVSNAYYYVSTFPANGICTWRLVGPPESFLDVQLCFNAQAGVDAMELYEGVTTLPSTLIVRQDYGGCYSFQTRGNVATVVFRSGPEVLSPFTVSYVSGSWAAYPLPTYCSGSITFDQPSGSISIPDNGLGYPSGLRCVWNLPARPGIGWQICLSGTLDASDSVAVYNNGLLIQDSLASNAFSCGNITVVFTSGNTSTLPDGRQFSFEFEAFNPGTLSDSCRRLTGLTQICGQATLNTPSDYAAFRNCTIVELLSLQYADNFTFPSLITVQTSIQLSVEIGALNLPALVQCQSISINNAVNGGFRAPLLEWIFCGSLYICANLPLVDLRALSHVYGEVRFNSVSGLTVIDLPQLRTCNTLRLSYGYDVVQVNAPMLQSVGTVEMNSLYQLTDLNISSLTTVSWIHISNCGVKNLVLPRLVVGQVCIDSNGQLLSLQLPVYYGSCLDITNNFALTSLIAPVFQNSYFRLQSSRVSHLTLPSYACGQVQLTQNVALKTIDMSAWTSGEFTLTQSVLIQEVSLPAVTDLDCLTLDANDALSVLRMCALLHISDVSISQCPALSCQDAINLFNTSSGFGISGCDATAIGTFGCQNNVTRVVDTAGCGFSVACIQAQIDASYSDQESSVSVPAGTYTGCAQPLSLRGKILTVFGAGMGVTVIDCGGVGRSFEFSSGEDASCELRDMTLRNGSESDGGLMSMAGASPVIRNCELAFGSASREGGAVALFSDAAPLFVGCYIHDNVAQRGGGISVSSSSVALLSTRVESNTAGAEGGGLAAVSTFAVSATASAFSFNHAQRGGGVYSDSALDLHGCVLRGNAASQFGGGLAAIPSEATGTWFNLTDCLVAANAAPGGAGVFGFSAQLAADNTTLRDNVAGADGGGGLSVTCNQNYRIFYNIIGPCPVAVSLRACTLANNTAAGVGGGALLRDVVVEVSGGAVVGNRAGTDGGGVYASVTALAASNVAWQDNAAGESGGALFCEPFTGTCDVRGATLSGNSAGVSGGAVHLCTAACPNATQGAVNPVLLPLPPLRESNTLGGNTVAAGGYGPDVATDPTRLSWLVAPPSTIVSGREFSGGTLTALVADSYGQTATSSASVLTLTLSVLHADGSSAGSDVVLGGTQTELANDGVAVFDVVTMTAVNTSFIDTNFILSCQLSELDSVYLNTPVFLSACSPGQGRPSATSRITCDDCAAGSYSSGDTVYVCTPCAAGSFSATAVSGACTPCPVKTHAPVAGAALCLACPDGYDASTPGAVECTQLAAYTGLTTAALAGTIGGVLVGLLIIACIIGVFVYRAARRRTMQKYYLDNDATVRTGTQETPLQKEVKKIIGSSSTTRIGGGLYSNVYKAKYENRWIALKVIKGEMATNSTAQQEFRREAVALSRLEDRRHPGIVKLQFFLSFNPMCIGVAFCTGGSLKRALQNKAFSSVREKVQLAGEAASALCSIHASNIVHLDIKTDNMLLSGDNHLVVADFGIARTLGLGGELDVAGEYVGTMDTKGDRESRSASLASQQHPSFAVNTMGSVAPGAIGPQFTLLSSTKSTDAYDTAYTPQYVDPIRILFDKNNDEAYLKMADVFSYGMVMWAIFSQEEPYAGEKPEDLVEKLRANPLLRPANLVDCPVFYDNLMRRCWHENPAMRPAFPEIHRVLTENMRDLYGFALDEGYANPSMDEHEVVAPAPPVAVPMQFADSFGSFNSGAFPGASMAMPSAYPVQPALQSVNSHINTMPLDSMTALSINSSDPNMSRVIPPLPLTAPPPIPSQPPPSPGSQPPPSPSSTTQTRAGSNPPSSPMSSLTSLGPPPPTHAAVAVVEREQPALPAKPPRRPTTTKPTVPPK